MSFRRNFVFVGVDTHKAQHVAAVVDCWHDLKALLVAPNDPAAFPGFLETVQSHCPAGMTPVFGLEGTGSLGRSLAAFLVKRGLVVKEINPVYTDRRRARSPHPDKSDPKDARAIAKVLVDDFLELPDAHFDEHAEAVALWVNHREQMVRSLTQVKNRLHALLLQQYPNYKALFYRPFGKTALAFWDRFPSPTHLQGVTPEALGAFLRQYSNHGLSTRRATEILSMTGYFDLSQSGRDARDQIIRQLVAQYATLAEQIAKAEEQLDVLLEKDGAYLTTMVGISTVTAARLVAEIGSIDRFASASKLARYAGVAPQESSSGGRTSQTQSIRGRRKLNCAFYTIALTQISTDRNGIPRVPQAYTYYCRKVSEGKSKKAALRCLMRRLCEIVYAIMKKREAYRSTEVARPPAA